MTTDDQRPIEVAWRVPAASVSARGVEARRMASREQCRLLAIALDIPAVERVELDYRITALDRGRFRLSGRVTACIVQSCIVSLEPVAADIDEPLEVELWPADQIEPEADTTRDHAVLEEDDPPEPIEGNMIPLGRLVYETIATALDPYPRAPGQHLEQPDAAPDETADRPNPFAALATWKPKKSGE